MKKEEVDFSEVEVIPKLPDYFNPMNGGPIPADLVGATIVRFGTVPEPRLVPGGGIVIDYVPVGMAKGELRRIVVACSDTGAWVFHQANLQANASLASDPESFDAKQS